MRQDQLDGMIVFLAVADAGGFSAAAARMGVSTSAVSQSIRQLEKRLGLVLFNRTTRSVRLTDVGVQFLARVRPAIEQLAAASEELGQEASHPSGCLRLSVPRAGYMIALQPVMAEYLERYPDVKVEISVDNALVDIVAGGFDAGIRFGDMVEKDMIAVKIGSPITAYVVGSPAYFSKHSIPQHPRDLISHNCVAFRAVTTGTLERWAFAKDGNEVEVAVDGRFIANDSGALVQGALDGLGLVYMVSGYIERFVEQGRLVRVLVDWSPALPSLTLYYPDRKRVPARLRALIDLLGNTQTRMLSPAVEGWLR